jgi:putative transposase
VWATKYRKSLLRGVVGERARELIRQICRSEEVDILTGHIAKDHVHLLLSLPPQVTISRLVGRLKGRTSYTRLNEFAHLRKAFWGRHVWARGYFCVSSGNVTDEVIKAYIENHSEEEGEDFRVEGEEEGEAAPAANAQGSRKRPTKPSS